ncbi:hypothetical protein [Phascolarctobacterium faecium]
MFLWLQSGSGAGDDGLDGAVVDIAAGQYFGDGVRADRCQRIV